MKHLLSLLVLILCTLPAMAAAGNRPPRKNDGQTTMEVTTAGTYLQCDIWDKRDTRGAGFPKKRVRSASDCYLLQFEALDAVAGDTQVCVPIANVSLTDDETSVCTSGAWLVYNLFTAVDKKGRLYCRYEAIMDVNYNVLVELTDTCGFE